VLAEVVMSKSRTLVLGLGCFLVLLGAVIIILVMLGMQGPPLGRHLVLAIRLDRPIVEQAVEDPLARLAGGEPIGLRDLRTALVRAASDDRVVGVRLRVDRYLGGFGTAQEVRSLLGRVRDAGKWTRAYLDTAGEFAPGNFDYLVAAGCAEVAMDPMGDVNLIGLSLQFQFLGGTLEKLGIRPEYPGVGDYKDARFQYTRRDFTPAQREMMEWLGGSWTDQLVEGVATSRGLDQDRVRYLIDRGPYLGDDALEAGLVDSLEDWHEFTRRVSREADDADVVGYRSYLRRTARSSSGPKIAIVTALGLILRGESGTGFNPLIGTAEVMGTDTTVRALRRARSPPGVKAVVFRVDSPGGTPLASEIIRREVARTADQLPVVVSMANVAASGGYWIACDAQRIVANPGAVVGSIGVLAGHLNLEPFLSDKLGITYGTLHFGANANLYGSLDDWTDPQRAVIDRILGRTYDRFVELVADGRDMSPEDVDAIGQGRVYTGVQGAANGLVDVLGGLDTAIAEARELAGIAPEARIQLVEFPKVQPWWRQLMGRSGRDEEAFRELVAALEELWRTGTVRSPGLVWLPPIHVR
jgi:protease-4